MSTKCSSITRPRVWLLAGCLLGGCAVKPAGVAGDAGAAATPPLDARPNVLLIIADDLGFSDLGSFGGEINTPNLDALARAGVRLTNFHTAQTCSPTRAMLLSGTDPHLAGIGNMAEALAPNQRGRPGHEGYLNFRVAALPELLRDAGYHTYLAGKWHLGLEEETGPAARGFERSFASLTGADGHLGGYCVSAPPIRPAYREDGKPVTPPAGFYSTRFYADKLIEYIDADRDDGKPFFGYLAFTAPHWPLQAPPESRNRYRGRYDIGYDALYLQRLARQRELGLVRGDAKPSARNPGERAWHELSDEEKRVEARKMEIYAAMVDDLDVQVGRVIDYLEEIGRFDDTLIVFMSDNGAEGSDLGRLFPQWAEASRDCDPSFEAMGGPASYVFYGPGWARAAVGPYHRYKTHAYEGGIRAPAFVSFPKLPMPGRALDAFASAMDVMPTVLELTGVAHPGNRYRDRDIVPMQGRSMLPLLERRADAVHGDDHVIGWELFGLRAVRRGDWKIVHEHAPWGSGKWELYHLGDDPGERNDLAAQLPGVLGDMLAVWDQYQRDNGVVLPEIPPPF